MPILHYCNEHQILSTTDKPLCWECIQKELDRRTELAKKLLSYLKDFHEKCFESEGSKDICSAMKLIQRSEEELKDDRAS